MHHCLREIKISITIFTFLSLFFSCVVPSVPTTSSCLILPSVSHRRHSSRHRRAATTTSHVASVFADMTTTLRDFLALRSAHHLLAKIKTTWNELAHHQQGRRWLSRRSRARSWSSGSWPARV